MIELRRTNSDNEAFRILIMELDNELTGNYMERQAFYDAFNIIENNQNVVVAYNNGNAVGCGCFKKFDDQSVEIKRMFVQKEFRCQKIASTILKELEKWAMESGFAITILETGSKQTEAIHLYQKSGYLVIENYGPYKDQPESICMLKKLHHQAW